MDKHLNKAEKRINFLFGLVEKIMAYIIKANDDLQKGIDKINGEIDDTTAHIYDLHDKLNRLEGAIEVHEDRLKRNVKLIGKLDDFFKGDK